MCGTRLAANTGRKKVAKNRHLGTIAQLCRAISSQLRHVSTIGKKNLLSSNISSTLVWGTPRNFNGFRVLATLLQRRHSTEVNQTLHYVWPSPGLLRYIYTFGISCPLTEFCHVQNSLCVHLCTIAQVSRAISSQLRHLSTIGKNLLKSNISPTWSYNIAIFGLLAAEICWRVWGTHANFNAFRFSAALLHSSLVLGLSQTLRRWTEGATCVRQGDHHVRHWPTFCRLFYVPQPTSKPYKTYKSVLNSGLN